MFDKNAYQREYYKNHPEFQERQRVKRKKWRENHRNQLRLYQIEWCKNHPDQVKLYGKRWYAKSEHKERVKEYHKIIAKNVKFQVLSHYSQGEMKCNRCGIEDMDVLCLDHINNGGDKERKENGAGASFYSWLVKNAFPEGYQVLCANCNLKKEIERRRNGLSI